MMNKNILSIKENSVTCKYGVLQHFEIENPEEFEEKPLVKHMAGRPKK